MENHIVYSALKTPDGTLLESLYRHDYRQYLDKNGKTYMIDGGLDYVRRSNNGDEELITVYNDEPHERVRHYAFRSGFGKDGTSKTIINTKICDMDDDYLTNAITYCKKYNVAEWHIQILKNELKFRNKKIS